MVEIRFEEATAFVTGGAQGIGLGISRALARRGTRLVLVDIDAEALQTARRELASLTSVETYVLDVRDREGFARVADEAEAALGPVSLLFNNAGVAAGAPVDRMSYDDWDWTLGINVGGVVNGIQTFVPRMLERGRGGYIVNTASGAGLAGAISGYQYVMSKFAVVGLSEALNTELRDAGIGVSVLCPGPVATKIMSNTARQQHADRLRPVIATNDQIAEKDNLLAQGTTPEAVGEMVCAAIQRNQLYIHTDAVMAELVKARTEMILAAMSSFVDVDAADPVRPVEGVTAPSTDLDGTYELTLHAPGRSQQMTLELISDGSTLTGSVKSDEGTQEILEPSCSGNIVTFKLPITVPMPLTLFFTATVDGDVISGSAKVGNTLSVDFDGKRI